MQLYRVDKREFNSEDIITPDTDYWQNYESDKKAFEELLNKYRPSGIPERKDCLFLFVELKDALRFYDRYGGHIYTVQVEGRIFHKGDMNKLDNIWDIWRFTEDENILSATVCEYWKPGTHTFSPAYEILTDKATVIREIAEKSQHDEFRKEFEKYNSIELTSLYKTLI